MLRRTLCSLVLAASMAAVTTTVAAQPAAAGASGVKFGALVSPVHGESFVDAQRRQVAAYGRMAISRVFYRGAPQAWPGDAGLSRRPVVVSFKYTPSEVVAGKHDVALRLFFTTAPKTYDVFWSFIHEPEDNVARGEFTAADYRAAWQHIAALANAANNIHLRSTLILMCFTMNSNSHRNWHDYYVASAQSMLAFDCYNHAGKHDAYGQPADIFRPLTTWSAANPTIRWGVSEVGSTLASTDPDGSKRAAWLRSVAAFLVKAHQARNAAAKFGIYFDTVGPNGTDYRLRDAKSKAAWRDVVQTY